MSKDEKVDGPRIAAQILNRMPAEKRRALLERIRGADPRVFQSIQSNIVVFEDIKDLTDQGLQRLIKEIDHRDLVYALKNAEAEVSACLLKNMSARKREMVLEDLKSLAPLKTAEVEEAQKRIAQVMDRLRTEGVIHRRSEGEEWI